MSESWDPHEHTWAEIAEHYHEQKAGLAMTSDTPDNGRAEQWEKGESFTWQLWDGDDMQTLWPVLEDSRVIAVATTEADRDHLIAARARAGLAQEMAEEWDALAFMAHSSEEPALAYWAEVGMRLAKQLKAMQ